MDRWPYSTLLRTVAKFRFASVGVIRSVTLILSASGFGSTRLSLSALDLNIGCLAPGTRLWEIGHIGMSILAILAKIAICAKLVKILCPRECPGEPASASGRLRHSNSLIQ
jgi:hypothetical protein